MWHYSKHKLQTNALLLPGFAKLMFSSLSNWTAEVKFSENNLLPGSGNNKKYFHLIQTISSNLLNRIQPKNWHYSQSGYWWICSLCSGFILSSMKFLSYKLLSVRGIYSWPQKISLGHQYMQKIGMILKSRKKFHFHVGIMNNNKREAALDILIIDEEAIDRPFMFSYTLII